MLHFKRTLKEINQVEKLLTFLLGIFLVSFFFLSNFYFKVNIDLQRETLAQTNINNQSVNQPIINTTSQIHKTISNKLLINLNITYLEQSISLKTHFLIVLSLTSLFIGIIIYLIYKFRRIINQKVYYDNLLKGPNYEYLKVWFHKLSVKDKQRLSVCVFDVKNFREINHIKKPQTGDKILIYLYQVIKDTIPMVKVYRRYADNFVLIFPFLNQQDIQTLLEKLILKIENDVNNNEIESFMLSFGICIDEFEESLSLKYTNAMVAKNSIKNIPTTHYAFYDNKLKELINESITLENSFKEAIKKKEFQIYYQPKYDMLTSEVVGAEALLRWFKPDALIPPSKFIPCFEKSGQIIELDLYVFESICQDLYQMKLKKLPLKPISLNVSRLTTFNMSYIPSVKELIKKYQIDPCLLIFEVTESAFYENETNLNNIVDELHQLGAKVDMDDFGTGVSSLRSLSKINFDTLKIDQNFTFNIGEEKTDQLIISTIMLAKRLNMKLVAEGVETLKQRDFLIKNGCYIAQGYLYSKPITLDDYFNILNKKTI